MARNQDNEGFEDLLKVLAWKRHEQPPPGYFDGFSAKITARIESEQLAPAWWQRFFTFIDPRPIYAGAFGLTMCGTLLFGLVFQAAPQAGQARLRIDELADAWPQTERPVLKTGMRARGLTLRRGDTSITPVVNAELYDSISDSDGPSIAKASFIGF
jgi:hypothetical protein